MMEVPRAVVEGSRVPLHRRPGVRKLATVAAVVAACFVGWKLLKLATRSDANKQLEARQDKARAQIGNGLDELFEAQLDRDTTTVHFVATFDVAAELGNGYSDHDCGDGFRDAFAEALGPDVVTFSTFSMDADSDLRLEITGTITPNGRSFQLANSRAEYPGIALAADMTFLGKKLHAEVEPAADIRFEHTTYGVSFKVPSETEVAGGILQGTCKQAAYALIEHLTKWKRPVPPAPPDPVEACERGFHCRENADALADSDPATAAKLYANACEHDDEVACIRLAELGLGGAKGVDQALVRVALDMACGQELAHACAANAQVRLMPHEPGKPASAWQRQEALLAALRACDLGAREGCGAVVPLLAGTPFAEAAPLFAGAKSVASKKLGTMFALRWGQWTKFDSSGQPTLWVTKRPAKLPEGAIVREFSRDQLPRGIVAPPDVETVYAVALHGGRGGSDEPCERCNPSGGGGSIYSMRSFDCVCALKRH